MRTCYRSCLCKRNIIIKLILNANNKKVIEVGNDRKNNVVIYINTDVYSSKSEAFTRYNNRINHLYNWGYDIVKDK
ncbi:MAG: hypothetical protein N4A63_04595 [Vallitalea sp.]|jgi:hypothetical protein|nr:hypothetical protein [Vallitalea sp.]